MSADTPESFAFDSLRPNEGALGPAKAGLRFGSLLGLGSGVPKTENDKEASWWRLARAQEFHEAKQVEPQQTRAFIFNVEGTYFFASINADAMHKSIEDLNDDQFAIAEVDERFARELTIDELPVEIHDNGSVIFEYYELTSLPGGKQVASDAKYSGGTWWSPDPDIDDSKYKPTESAMKIDPEYLAGFFRAYILEKRWQSQL